MKTQNPAVSQVFPGSVCCFCVSSNGWFTINRGTGSGTRCRATWRPVVCFHDGSPWFAPRSLRRTTAGWLRTYCVELFCWHTDGSFSYGLDLLRLDAEEMRLPESWISCGCSMT